MLNAKRPLLVAVTCAICATVLVSCFRNNSSSGGAERYDPKSDPLVNPKQLFEKRPTDEQQIARFADALIEVEGAR